LDALIGVELEVLFDKNRNSVVYVNVEKTSIKKVQLSVLNRKFQSGFQNWNVLNRKFQSKNVLIQKF
jgi:hypothetical protein